MENNLNLYYIFYHVAQCKNISKAAKLLYISQPAISKAISKLEQSLDAILFIRNSRGVTLTLEGELLFEQIQTAFTCIHTGEEKVKLAGQLGMGHIQIGVSTTLCKYVLLPYLKQFISRHPHIKISISCQSSIETIHALLNHTIDIGLIGYPESDNPLTYRPLMEIHDIFVTTDHYLQNFKKRNGDTLDSIYENANFILLDKENITRKYVDSALAYQKIDLKNIMEVSNLELLIEFAKIDLGISCVIKEFVLNELKEGILQEFSSPLKISSRKIGFAYLSSILRENPAVQQFMQDGM